MGDVIAFPVQWRCGDWAWLGASRVQVLSCDGEIAEVVGRGPFGQPWLTPCKATSLRRINRERA